MTDETVLLPRPRKLRRLEGTFSKTSARFVWLSGRVTPELLRTGGVVKAALTQAGAAPELTAAAGRDTGDVAATVRVDSRRVRRREGYRLTVSPNGIELVGHDAAGAYYGAMTLRQLARQYGATGGLPCVQVDDWPDFPHRGVMIDVSRDRVPTMDTLYLLVDLLSEWKVNELQLYTEHTYAYRDHAEVWGDASPMTGEQIMQLDAYCRQRFVELVPNQNSFGHMERWLMKPGYRDLAEHPESPIPRALNPIDPRSIELIAGMFDELLPHFSSGRFNVGCDEVPLGDGRSRAAAAKHGVGRVYLDFLLKVHKLVQGHGRTMQFWGDIILHHPELISELPDDVVALEWGYQADHPFAPNAEKFAQAGLAFYACPGTSSWNTIAGRTDNARTNIRSAAEAGLEHGAIGFLNTDWGDNGHWQQWPVAYLGYAYGAAVGWCGAANREIDLPRVLDMHAFQDSAGMMGRAVYDLGNAYQQPGVTPRNSSVLQHLLLRSPASEEPVSRLTVDALERTEEYVESALDGIDRADMAGPEGDRIAAEMRHVAALLRHACHVGVAHLEAMGNELPDVPLKSLWTHHHRDAMPPHVAAEIGKMPAATRKKLDAELGPLVEEYRRLWLARSRPGGLDDSITRWEHMLAAYRDA